MATAWRNFKNILFTVCTWPNRAVGAKILSGFQFEGKTDVWITQVRRVKPPGNTNSSLSRLVIFVWKKNGFTCSSTWLGSVSQIRSSHGSVLSFSESWEMNSLKRMESRFFESKKIKNQSPRSAFLMRRSKRSSFPYLVLALRWKMKRFI